MRIFFIMLLFCSTLGTSAQTKSTPWGKQAHEKKMNPYVKIKAGAATIGMGGVLLACSMVVMGEAKTQEGKVPAYILAGGGGVLCFVGGVLLGNGVTALAKQNSTARLKFTGTSLTLNF